MNTQSNTARWLEEEIAKAGAPSHGEQVPLLEEDGNEEKALTNPPHLTGENIRAAFLQIAQAITTQAQETTTQSQDMTTQANQEVVPHPYQCHYYGFPFKGLHSNKSSYFL